MEAGRAEMAIIGLARIGTKAADWGNCTLDKALTPPLTHDRSPLSQ
jgi:hypothetical protein